MDSGIGFCGVAFLWTDSLGDRRADELLAALKAAGRDGLTQSDILRQVFQRNVKVEELARIGALLQAAGLLVRRQDVSRGGRPAMRWYYQAPVQHEDVQSSGHEDPHSRAAGGPEPNDSNDRSPATGPSGPTSVVTVVGSGASAHPRDATSPNPVVSRSSPAMEAIVRTPVPRSLNLVEIRRATPNHEGVEPRHHVDVSEDEP